MERIYLDNRHHFITITDEAYKRILEIVNSNRVCGKCQRLYTTDIPMVAENLCLTCLLRKEENRLLTFAGVLSVSQYGTSYKFLDPKGYVYYSSTSSEKVERSEYQTIIHWGFPAVDSYTAGDTQASLSPWHWFLHGDVKKNSVLVIENIEYSSGTRRAFLSYKGGGCVFFTRRKGAMRTLWNQAMERLQAAKGERASTSYYESEIYEIIADLASAEYDAQQKGVPNPSEPSE